MGYLPYFQAQDTIKPTKAKLIFGLDANRTFVAKNKTKFVGFRIGVELNDKHKIGLGFYGMERPILLKRKINADLFPNANDSILLNFNYNNFFYEYVLHRTKRWDLSIPLSLGGGEVNMTFRDTITDKREKLFHGKTSVFLPSVAVQYKLTRWFALGAGVGYRFAFSNDADLIAGLNAPVYVYRAKIFMGEILRMCFKKDYSNPDWDDLE